LEEVYPKDYRTFEEAEANMGEFVEEVYNKKRLHSGLGYLCRRRIRGAERPESRKLTLSTVRKMGFTLLTPIGAAS
jgi:transposase InsO family protein